MKNTKTKKKDVHADELIAETVRINTKRRLVIEEEERQATEKWKADKTPEEIAEIEARPLYFCSKDRPRGITKRGNMTRGEINSLVDDMYEMNDTEFILKYDIDPHEFEGKCPHPLLFEKRWIKSGNGYKENFCKPRKVKL